MSGCSGCCFVTVRDSVVLAIGVFRRHSEFTHNSAVIPKWACQNYWGAAPPLPTALYTLHPTPRQPQQEPERSAPGFSILRERHTSHEPRSGPSDYISTATNPHKLHQALTRQREMIERQQDELNW